MTRLAYDIVYSLEDLIIQAERCCFSYFSKENNRILNTKIEIFIPTLVKIEGRGDIHIGNFVERAQIWGTKGYSYLTKKVLMSHGEKGWSMRVVKLSDDIFKSYDEALAVASQGINNAI